jgi:hypothetical protein
MNQGPMNPEDLKRAMFDPNVMVVDTSITNKGAVVGGPDGMSRCLACGHCWRRSKRALWWPISFRWADHSNFAFWRIELGGETLERRIYKSVLGVWRLRIVFGDRKIQPGINLDMERVAEWQRARAMRSN